MSQLIQTTTTLNPDGPPPPATLGLSPMLSWRRHKLVMLAVFLLVASAGVPLSFKMGKPEYATTAVIFVSPRFQKNLQDDKEQEMQSNSQYREFVQQQVKTINRYDIVADALKRLGERRKLWQKPDETERRATERLQAALDIKPLPDTYQVLVTLTADKAEGLDELVNMVVDVYLEKAKDEEYFGSDDRLKNLRGERDKLLKELEDKRTERTNLAQKMGVTTFNDALLNPYDQLLTSAKIALGEAQRARILADAQLTAIDDRTTEGRQRLQAYAQDAASKDNGLNALKASLHQRRSVLLTNMSGLTPEHPGRRAAEQEMRELDAEMETASHKVIATFAASYLEQRRSEAFRAHTAETQIAAEVTKQEAQASAFAANYQHALQLGGDMDRARRRLDSIEDRVDQLQLEINSPGFFRRFSPAREPEMPVKGGKKKFLLIGVMAAFFLALVAPITLDFFDPRIRKAGDLERIFGFPPLAWLLERVDEATSAFAEDQLLRLATALDRDHYAHGTQIVVLTGARAGAGTSTLALELAQELRRRGVHALALEANALNPDPRYHAQADTAQSVADDTSEGLANSTDNAVSLTGLLAGASHFDRVVPEGRAQLPIGALEGRRHISNLSSLGVVLEEFKQRYQVILIDAPPLLLSADAEALINRADTTLLVVAALQTTRTQVRRAAARLEQLAPKSVGILLNRVPVHPADKELCQLVAEYQTGQRA